MQDQEEWKSYTVRGITLLSLLNRLQSLRDRYDSSRAETSIEDGDGKFLLSLVKNAPREVCPLKNRHSFESPAIRVFNRDTKKKFILSELTVHLLQEHGVFPSNISDILNCLNMKSGIIYDRIPIVEVKYWVQRPDDAPKTTSNDKKVIEMEGFKFELFSSIHLRVCHGWDAKPKKLPIKQSIFGAIFLRDNAPDRVGFDDYTLKMVRMWATEEDAKMISGTV